MMSDGPTPPKRAAKSRLVEKTTDVPTTESSAEKADSTVEQVSISLSEKSVIEERPVTRAEFNALSAELNEIRQKYVRILNIEKLALDENAPVEEESKSLGEKSVMKDQPDLREQLVDQRPNEAAVIFHKTVPAAHDSLLECLKRSHFLSQEDHVYRLGKKKGLVAIINNFTVQGQRGWRKGTVADEHRIRDFFGQRAFEDSYEVCEQRRDLEKVGFLEELKRLSAKLKGEASKYHSFFLFIMSHGGAKGVQAVSAEGERHYIPIADITSEFESTLVGCPKVIVIQACRGKEENLGIEAQDGSESGDDECDDGSDADENDENKEKVATGVPHYIPVAADMLLAHATVKDYVALRKGDYGSWFLINLFEILEEAHNTEKYYSSHLVEILTAVQHKVAEIERVVRKKQMPSIESTLRKKFYLLPPVLPQ